MYISIGLVLNQSASVYSFNNVVLEVPEEGVVQKPLPNVSVHWNEEQYVYIDYSNTDVVDEVKAAIIKIAKAFHLNGIWQAANITAAIA